MNKEEYLGQEANLKYPSVDHLVKINMKKGHGCLIFKRDLKRAYRQISVCPADIPLLGYCLEGL